MEKNTEIQKITENQFKSACIDSYGNVDIIAKRLCVTPLAVKQAVASNQELKAYIDDEAGLSIDMAEGKLLELVQRGNLEAIKYFLNSKGKSRGYGNSENILGLQNIQINFGVSLDNFDPNKGYIENEKVVDNGEDS